jgi:prephenate dehydrogenase
LTKQISIIGLNQIGASIGLALAAQDKEYYRVGYDRNVKTGPEAVRSGAIEKSFFNLPSAVEKADIIVLSVPMDEIKAALSVIGPAMKKGAVIVDTSPLKKTVEEWAVETVPLGCFFVSVSPTLNPDSFSETTPSADLFKNSLMVITSPTGTSEDTIEMVLSLAETLGAKTLFSDPLENDGLTAAVRTLPELTAAALIHAAADLPGWLESRKLAGAAFASGSSPLQSLSGSESPSDDILNNQANVLRVLDNLISVLNDLHDLVADGNQKELNEFITSARDTRKNWIEQRQSADWEKSGEKVQPPDFMSRLFGSRGKPAKS